MSTLKFNTWQNQAGTEEYFKCRAWVNFNGTGTVAIRAAGNVSGITDNGVGNYTVNFENDMPDDSYSISGGGTEATVTSGLMQFANLTTNGFRVQTVAGSNGANQDLIRVFCQTFR